MIAFISLVTNVWLAKPGQEDPTTSIIIVVLVLISGGIRFVQELRSDKATTNLSKMIVNTATVIRDGLEQELPIDELVVGDLVKLSAGDMIPADVILFESRDFFVQQSGLTGESDAVEKLALNKSYESKCRESFRSRIFGIHGDKRYLRKCDSYGSSSW